MQQHKPKHAPQLAPRQTRRGTAQPQPKTPGGAALSALQRMADQSAPVQRQQALQVQANRTGLPDRLKSGIEGLSGMSMDHVRVHRNSSKPAQLQAHAYAQGSDIHLGPGQEQHLPHEAWHVVQQAQGRVKPTMQLKGIGVNDDVGLEREADAMGARSLQRARNVEDKQNIRSVNTSGFPTKSTVQRVPLNGGGFNMVGENHDESQPRRDLEKKFGASQGINENRYLQEGEFSYLGPDNKPVYGDPWFLRLETAIAFIQLGPVHLRKFAAEHDSANTPQKKAMAERKTKEWINGTIDFSGTYEKIFDSIVFSFYLSSEDATTQENWKNLRTSFEGFTQRTAEIRSPLPTAYEDIRPIANDLATDFEQVETHFQTAVGRQMDKDQSVLDRSKAMNDAANANTAVSTFWKVGQKHIEQIQDDANMHINYTIVTQDEFNKVYLPWERKYIFSQQLLETKRGMGGFFKNMGSKFNHKSKARGRKQIEEVHDVPQVEEPRNKRKRGGLFNDDSEPPNSTTKDAGENLGSNLLWYDEPEPSASTTKDVGKNLGSNLLWYDETL